MPSAFSAKDISEKATYVSDCFSQSSINNPLLGNEIEMVVGGFFDLNLPKKETLGDSIGGLKKTTANGGFIYTYKPFRLFNMAGGCICVKMSVENGISNGVLDVFGGENTSESSLSAVKKFVVFSLNHGDFYISQPGIYFAFTDIGIEATIWTSKGKNTILIDDVNINPNEDFEVEMRWDVLGDYFDTERFYVRINESIYEQEALISFDSIIDTYGVPLPFCILDTPKQSSDLSATIRRIEIYGLYLDAKSPEVSEINNPQHGSLDFSFDICGIKKANIFFDSIKFKRVVSTLADLLAVGPIGSSLHYLGEDLGKEISNEYPKRILDLPIGFIEVKEENE